MSLLGLTQHFFCGMGASLQAWLLETGTENIFSSRGRESERGIEMESARESERESASVFAARMQFGSFGTWAHAARVSGTGVHRSKQLGNCLYLNNAAPWPRSSAQARERNYSRWGTAHNGFLIAGSLPTRPQELQAESPSARYITQRLYLRTGNRADHRR